VKKNFFNLLLAFIGVVVLVPGVIEILLSFTRGPYTFGQIAFGGDFMLWRGLILLSSGCIYLFSINQANQIEQDAQAVSASFMIWIVGGMELLSIVLGSVPGEGGRWVATWGTFVNSYKGPFIPSIFLLPFSIGLVMFVLYRRAKRI